MGHLDDVAPFLPPQTQESIRRLIDRGYKTAKEFMRTKGDDVQFVEVWRIPRQGGPEQKIAEFRPVLVQFGTRATSWDRDAGPIGSASSSGNMIHEHETLDLKGNVLDLQPDDIVIYEGRSAKVTAVTPPAFGVIVSDLDLSQ